METIVANIAGLIWHWPVTLLCLLGCVFFTITFKFIQMNLICLNISTHIQARLNYIYIYIHIYILICCTILKSIQVYLYM